MRKIPTLFVREYPTGGKPRLTERVTPGCEWVLAGEGRATRKFDGTCVLLRRDGMAVHAYARREVTAGGIRPHGFIEVDYDPNRDRTIGWQPAEQSPWSRYITEALAEPHQVWLPGTYELIGPKVNGNPEGADGHLLIAHADAQPIDVPAPHDLDSARLLVEDLASYGWEGVVWHHSDGRMAKLKGRDFR